MVHVVFAQRGASTSAAVQLLPPGGPPGSGAQHATLYWLGHNVAEGCYHSKSVRSLHLDHIATVSLALRRVFKNQKPPLIDKEMCFGNTIEGVVKQSLQENLRSTPGTAPASPRSLPPTAADTTRSAGSPTPTRRPPPAVRSTSLSRLAPRRACGFACVGAVKWLCCACLSIRLSARRL